MMSGCIWFDQVKIALVIISVIDGYKKWTVFNNENKNNHIIKTL